MANDTDAFVQAVGEFLDARGLLPARAAVVVGVSGGADSVALLSVLRELASQPERAYRLTVAHLNHGLRADAQADADFVAGLARRWGVPCLVGRRDVPAEAKDRGVGIEQAARMARYEFLQSAAGQAGATHVAVGHHADDNAETILYRIVRGTHLRGLAGIPASRALGSSGIVLVRPLLGVTRAEVEAYCRAAGLSWRTDSTNADTQYRRNFIRNELLPLLRSRLNRRADEALLRLADAAAQAEEVLSGLARDAVDQATVSRASYPRVARASRPCVSRASCPRQTPAAAESAGAALDAASLARQHPLIQTLAVRQVLEELGVPMRSLGADRLADVQSMLAGNGPSSLSLPGGWSVRLDRGRLIVEAGEADTWLRGAVVRGAVCRNHVTSPQPAVVVLECPGRTTLPDGREVICRIEPFDEAAFRTHCATHPAGEELLDADQVRGRLLCRPRAPGDAFVPLGAPGRQTVSDFLTNLKLPPLERDRVRCLCDELGIVYVAPLRIDDRVKVTAETKNVLRLTWGGVFR